MRTLAMTSSGDSPEQITVYLHGNAGAWMQEEVLRILRKHPDVQEVSVSDVSWAILRVTLVRDASEPATGL